MPYKIGDPLDHCGKEYQECVFRLRMIELGLAVLCGTHSDNQRLVMLPGASFQIQFRDRPPLVGRS